MIQSSFTHEGTRSTRVQAASTCIGMIVFRSRRYTLALTEARPRLRRSYP